MIELQNKLSQLLDNGCENILQISEHELAYKRSIEKWSKKEILGHLIDSAVNNLQRFTEIQFSSKPYKIKNYNQNELVKFNDYQNSEIEELLNFWKAINLRIFYIFGLQTKETLSFKILFDNNDESDLKFLMQDYVNHLEYHLNQILD